MLVTHVLTALYLFLVGTPPLLASSRASLCLCPPEVLGYMKKCVFGLRRFGTVCVCGGVVDSPNIPTGAVALLEAAVNQPTDSKAKEDKFLVQTITESDCGKPLPTVIEPKDEAAVVKDWVRTPPSVTTTAHFAYHLFLGARVHFLSSAPTRSIVCHHESHARLHCIYCQWASVEAKGKADKTGPNITKNKLTCRLVQPDQVSLLVSLHLCSVVRCGCVFRPESVGS